ncbi:class B sortase [Bulleidia sp. HCP3S3_F2]|uniref:class B sortase n=1 Tax=unclassified Bulleidia TaxID=2704656 RepID=UPI003F88CF01
MKKKTKIRLIAAIAAAIGITGICAYNVINTKKAYNYTDYYVDVPATNETNKDEETSEKELSLPLLKKTNPDVVGIIEFDDRIIYEPVVQAPDNDYYVRRNIEQKYAAAGIPYISGDGNIDAKNVVIYGHSSTRSNIIFTPLMDYINSDYYTEHPTFRFIMEDETRTYQIIAVMNIDLNNLDHSLEFTQSSWRSNNDFQAFISNTINNSLYRAGVSVSNEDQLMTLVTCDTRDENKRIVVIGKQIR